MKQETTEIDLREVFDAFAETENVNLFNGLDKQTVVAFVGAVYFFSHLLISVCSATPVL